VVVGVVLVGMAASAVACSNDDRDNGQPTGSNAGEAGSSGGSAGSASGAAGKNTGGTQTSMPSAGGAGAVSGSGDVASVPSLVAQCLTCSDAQCEDTMTACTGNPACTAWLTCVVACTTSDCVAACDKTGENAARVYRGVYDCMCTSCATDCSALGACTKKTCIDDVALPNPTTAEATLAETGLYARAPDAGGAGGGDLAMPIAIAPYVRAFEPKYPLWADGSGKQRYVYIPKCATIDTTDMDHWSFPVGTRFWKTFKNGDTAVETRMLHRFGPAAADWVYATYQWDTTNPTDPSAALWTQGAAVPNANGTTHDIPALDQCKECHTTGLPERVLGFGAFQLSHDPSPADVAIQTISDLGWLTKPARAGFQVPGNALQQAALGYLHGNCGGCHNDDANIPNAAPQYLRLRVDQTVYATTDIYTTTVGVAIVSEKAEISGKHRIEPKDSDNSGLLIRMQARGTALQMPPLGSDSTKVSDTDIGVKAVTDWINSFP
jgi:hypothetical protein